MKNRVKLITYENHFSSGDFHQLNNLSNSPLSNIFNGSYQLLFNAPVDGADSGVDSIEHRKQIETTKDIEEVCNFAPSTLVLHAFIDALGGGDTQYLIARAIQFFAPGIPYLYYPGFLECRSDAALPDKIEAGQGMNRHSSANDDIESMFKQPLTQKLINLIRLRNNHPAFNGEFYVEAPEDNLLEMRWEENEHWIMLHVDLAYIAAVITGSDLEGKIRYLN